MQKDANLVELDKCCQTHIFLQNFVLIQPRTSPLKICKLRVLPILLGDELPAPARGSRGRAGGAACAGCDAFFPAGGEQRDAGGHGGAHGTYVPTGLYRGRFGTPGHLLVPSARVRSEVNNFE